MFSLKLQHSKRKIFTQILGRNIKHLMAGPKGNSEFCFPEAKPRGTLIEVEGKQNSRFPAGPVIKCFFLYLLKNCK